MLERLLIAGSGGQGIVLVGKLVATVAVKSVPHVTFFPAYGAEVRGGTSNCQVILSSDEIASPVSQRFESMLIMNQASADRHLSSATADCLVIVNRSLCRPPTGPHVKLVDATRVADRLGDTRVANLIMLGAYLAARPILPPPLLEKGIEQILAGKTPALISLNLKAFRFGLGQEPH